MKALAVLAMLVAHECGYPQGAFTNQTHSVLQKVISDYPNHFRNIKGARVSDDPQSTDYTSTIEIPGALTTVITQYSSSEKKNVYSWKCVMMESDDFAAVAKKYKDLFNQLKNSIIKIDGQKPFILNGAFETPTEERKFTTSALYLLPAAPGDLKKLKVELTLEYYVTEWKLAILVYDQEEEEVVME